MCSGARIQSEFLQASKFGKRLLQVVINFQRTLTGHSGLQRMQASEGLQSSNLLVDDGIVLHRTRSEGIEAVVHAEVVVTEVRVVANDSQLVTLWQAGSFLSVQSLWQLGCRVCAVIVLWQRIAFASFLR